MRYIVIILITFSLAFSGCISLEQPNTKFEYYTLEYDALRTQTPCPCLRSEINNSEDKTFQCITNLQHR